MKRILLLAMLALTICSSCFAYHIPDREELNRVQSVFSGYYLDKKLKGVTEDISFNDNGNVWFGEGSDYHLIRNANVEVDFNNHFTVKVTGDCAYPDCNVKSLEVIIASLGYSSAVNMQSYSVTVIKTLKNNEVVRQSNLRFK